MLAHVMEQDLEERPAPVAPLVKWAGGKGAMVEAIMAAMPTRFGAYFEPFCGGAAVAFALEAHHGRHPMTLGDANADLIRAYRAVARDPERVIRRLRWMARNHCPAFYAGVRSQWNADQQWSATDPPRPVGGGWNHVERAAAFLYLNRTCFNGLWRVNQRGEFNVPMGAYQNPTICDPTRVRDAARVLAPAALLAQDYRATAEGAREGDVVFFDPPYVPRSPTASFTAYSADGFGDAQQRELAAFALALVKRGVHVILTNHDVPRVRELYGSTRWKRRRVMMPRSIARRAASRGAIAELLIVGRP